MIFLFRSCIISAAGCPMKTTRQKNSRNRNAV
jgi:hypothetical protein